MSGKFRYEISVPISRIWHLVFGFYLIVLTSLEIKEYNNHNNY